LLSQNRFPEPNRHTLVFLHQFYCEGSHSEHHWRCSNPTNCRTMH
jgi:hypothetical protein